MSDKDSHTRATGSAATPPLGSETARQDGSAGKGRVGSAVSDMASAATKEGKALGEKAKEAAADQATRVKDATTSHLDSFADALRAAGDELRSKESGPAAEMVSHAASGLESMSRSIQGRSTGDIVSSVRRFGRENPMAFFAGSVLAGLALGRLAAASPNHGHDRQADRDPALPAASSARPVDEATSWETF